MTLPHSALPPGPRVGALLDAVERWWEAADFAPDRSQCLQHLKELLLDAGPNSTNKTEG